MKKEIVKCEFCDGTLDFIPALSDSHEVFSNKLEEKDHYECSKCKHIFSTYEWYGLKDKSPLPELNKGWVREQLKDGRYMDYSPEMEYVSKDDESPYCSVIYDKYGRVSSRLVQLDLSNW